MNVMGDFCGNLRGFYGLGEDLGYYEDGNLGLGMGLLLI